MDELSFKLEIFEGPLDLMLALIARHKLNIRDIEISILLEQFLNYLEKAREANIDLAAEFIEMAAHLIYIKTADLLPKHEAQELKKELSGRLIEYAQCKAVAERLKRRFLGDVVFVREPLELPVDPAYHGSHDSSELLGYYLAVSTKSETLKNDAKKALAPIVTQSYVSVFTKIMFVLKRLRRVGSVNVRNLYRGQTRSAQVAIFLALLELSKNGHIDFSEDGEYIEFKKKTPAPEAEPIKNGVEENEAY